MYWSFIEVLKPIETYYVENIKSTNFILGTNTKIHKFTNPWIFNQTTKIDTHEEKYLYSIQSNVGPLNSDGSNTMDGSKWFESPVNFPCISKVHGTVHQLSKRNETVQSQNQVFLSLKSRDLGDTNFR